MALRWAISQDAARASEVLRRESQRVALDAGTKGNFQGSLEGRARHSVRAVIVNQSVFLGSPRPCGDRESIPTRGFNLHYGESFVRPQVRHWSPIKSMVDFYQCWEKKVLPTPVPKSPSKKGRWSDVAHLHPKPIGARKPRTSIS
jgi:hypothetical protein